MKKEDFVNAIEKIEDKKRKFKQTYELVINLTGLNLKKPEQQIEAWVELPHGTGKEVKIGALVGGELKEQADKVCDLALIPDDFVKYPDKKAIKKLSRSYNYFIAQANIMPLVAKTFGRYFGPHGKMPNPKVGCVVPPNANLQVLVDRLKKTVKASARTQASAKVRVGTEDMDVQKVAENMLAVYNAILHKLPQERNNIKNVLIKKTMSAPIKVEEGK
jgi:large subunit ribosomal protein L1